MSQPRLQWKVGMFVFIGLGLVAGLMIYFSKGSSLFRQTRTIYMKTTNVGGIKPQAAVYMAGVPIGNVKDIVLAPDGKSVVITMEIYSKYKIYKDAQFTIDSFGLLGDQFVAIRPRDNVGGELPDGAEVTGQEPLNYQEIGRTSAAFIQRLDGIAINLSNSLDRVDKTVLSENTLTNLSTAVANFRVISDKAMGTIDGVNALVKSNETQVSQSLSNLVLFSDSMNKLATELQLTLSTNRTDLTLAIKNFESASSTVKNIFHGVEEGHGLVGALLKDENMTLEVRQMINNISVLSSNKNRYGLFYKDKTAGGTIPKGRK